MYAKSLDRINNIENFLMGSGLTGPLKVLTGIIALELAAFANEGENNGKYVFNFTATRGMTCGTGRRSFSGNQ